MDYYQFIDIDSKFGVGRSSVPEKSDFDRNLLEVLVQPPVSNVRLDSITGMIEVLINPELRTHGPQSNINDFGQI